MKKILQSILCLLLCLFCFAGCSSASYAVANGTAEAAAGTDADYLMDGETGIAEDYESTAPDSTADSSEKLVYSGSVSLESKTFDDTYSWIRKQIEELDGMIENEYVYRSGYDSSGEVTDQGCRTLSMTIRIPSGQFYSFLDDLEGNCRVISRSTSIINITQSYNDVSVQIEALEKQETSLLNMMDQAATIEDMIKVQDRLTEVQTELNQLKSERSAMDTDVAYSTLDLEMQEVDVYTGSSVDSFGTKAITAITSGLRAFANAIGSFVLVLLYGFPFLLLAAIILAAAVHFLRRTAKKRPEKAETKEKDHTIV